MLEKLVETVYSDEAATACQQSFHGAFLKMTSATAPLVVH
jgi:hypothetical protein